MKFSHALLLSITLILPLSIMAEDTAAEQKPTSQEATKITEQKAQPKAVPKSRPSEREFDPTEEISEDLSVPFPVDI